MDYITGGFFTRIRSVGSHILLSGLRGMHKKHQDGCCNASVSQSVHSRRDRRALHGDPRG